MVCHTYGMHHVFSEPWSNGIFSYLNILDFSPYALELQTMDNIEDDPCDLLDPEYTMRMCCSQSKLALQGIFRNVIKGNLPFVSIQTMKPITFQAVVIDADNIILFRVSVNAIVSGVFDNSLGPG